MSVLREQHLAPYIMLATALIGRPREGGGNMFRHQLDTMAILVDYGYVNPTMLKASIIHDLVEDIPEFSRNVIINTDFEGDKVYNLVLEVTRRDGETKPEFLTRILQTGSYEAKLIKCADRISNMISLGFVNRSEFIKRYCDETVKYIFPIAEQVDANMRRELGDLVASRMKYFELFTAARALQAATQ
jgi:GTP pyrophosphokinase